MVGESTGRFLYLYDPENDITVADGEPIRDIATIWDVEVNRIVNEGAAIEPTFAELLAHTAGPELAGLGMVGHTGKLAAAIEAVETVDEGLGRLVQAIRDFGGALLVTADHGNCELMRDEGPTQLIRPTQCRCCSWTATRAKLACGRLADVAPTLLDLMGLPKPADMTGVTLLRLRGKTCPEK